jgi:universal stress protein E
MQPIDLKRLLIASDSLDGMDVALEKAARIEHYTGAELLALQTVYDPVADEPDRVLPAQQQAQLIEALKAAERRALLTVAEPLREHVATLDVQIAGSQRAADGISEAARRWHADLLIKPVSRHHPVADYFHTPVDWALMREAPCPVLVSKRPSWQAPFTVLAAVDVTDTGHGNLNRAVLRGAATLAAILDAELHVATAYPDLGQRVDALQVANDFAGIKADMRKARQTALESLLAELGIDGTQVHLLEGRPGSVIPALATRLDATVTVLGSAARRGLSKLVIGNTAEDIIARLQGDLLAVRES